MTFAVTALIWRIYIFRAAEDIGPVIQASANPEGLDTRVSYRTNDLGTLALARSACLGRW